MKRLWYLTVSVTVLHPETRMPILVAGSSYSLEYLKLVFAEFGIDEIQGEWFAL